MQDGAAADGRRLLRVLFVWLGQVPTGTDAAGLLKLQCLMPPAMLQQLLDAACWLRGEPLQHVVEVRVGIVPVQPR